MGYMGQRSFQVAFHRYPLLSQSERLEPPGHSGVANCQQSAALQVDYAEWPDPYTELDLCSLLRSRMVGNHGQLSDGWRSQPESLHRIRRQAELHLRMTRFGASDML